MISSTEMEHSYGTQLCGMQIWLPTELWTDSFKMLSRRELLRHVQPVCRRFHAICEQNVPNVHVIEHFDPFLEGLAKNLPEANRQFDDLRGEVLLHVKQVGNPAFNKRLYRAQMCVLKYSLVLFRGCQLTLLLDNFPREQLREMFAYLDILQPMRPTQLNMLKVTDSSKFWQLDELLRIPTILHCPRLSIFGLPNTRTAPSAEVIAHWAHYLPTNCDHSDDGSKTLSSDGRIILVDFILPSACAELIELCKTNLLQAETEADRRPFLIHFQTTGPPTDSPSPWRIEHRRTGEVLLFERISTDQTNYFRLRRCLADVLGDAEQFYRKIFKNGFSNFRATPTAGDGIEPPMLTIR
uniref:F-box domain-containing protein n=1 Tax=Globodera rostochiensis TaxID=31243 RepID=A0A914HC56_GLORO